MEYQEMNECGRFSRFILRTIFVIAGLLIVAFPVAPFAACKAGLSNSWRTVGAGSSIRYVCQKEDCGGSKNYIEVKTLDAKKFSTAGMVSSLKASGRRTSSPISGYSGLRTSGKIKGANRVIQVYFKPNVRGGSVYYLEAYGESLNTSITNHKLAKSTFSCS